ncbi:hypothetical protein ACHQM5_017617 [Ranunculus cassubicifolius]
MLHSHPFLSPNPSLTFPHSHHHPSHYLFNKPHNFISHQIRLKPCLAQLTTQEEITTTTTQSPIEEDGPIELPPNTSIFATNDDPSPLQIATSVLLTGAISVFLFRAVRRRAKRAKELKYRSTGAKSIKEEALDNLKALKLSTEDPGKPPSAIQALLGGIAAGVITLILYKFATTVEAGLNRQAISDNFSVRQITITIRTIINGICYLATFVFGINAVGLVLYSGQLALNSFMEGSTDNEENLGTSPSSTDASADNKEDISGDVDSSDKNQ